MQHSSGKCSHVWLWKDLKSALHPVKCFLACGQQFREKLISCWSSDTPPQHANEREIMLMHVMMGQSACSWSGNIVERCGRSKICMHFKHSPTVINYGALTRNEIYSYENIKYVLDLNKRDHRFKWISDSVFGFSARCRHLQHNQKGKCTQSTTDDNGFKKKNSMSW